MTKKYLYIIKSNIFGDGWESVNSPPQITQFRMKFKMGYKNKDDHLLDEMYTRQFFQIKREMQKTTLNVLSIEHKKDIFLELHVFFLQIP